MLILLWLLQGLDILTTLFALKRGGVEENDILAWFFKRFGAKNTLVYAKIGFAAFVYWLYSIGQLNEQFIWGLCGCYTALIVWNVVQIKKQ